MDIKHRVNKGRSETAMLNRILWNKNIFKETKIKIYGPESVIQNLVTYGAETWMLNTNLRSKLLAIK